MRDTEKLGKTEGNERQTLWWFGGFRGPHRQKYKTMLALSLLTWKDVTAKLPMKFVIHLQKQRELGRDQKVTFKPSWISCLTTI